jgi:cytochrome c oxidase subunit 1
MHFLGLNGMPRRTAVYDGNMGWNTPNMIATVGAFILALGIGIYFSVMIYTFFKGEKSGRDPWDGRTFEWSIPNPPPEYNFAITPHVHARDGFWYDKHHKEETAKEQAAQAKEQAAHGGIHMPSQSWFPILTATALLTAGIFFANHIWEGAIAGGAAMFLSIYFWATEGPGGYHIHAEEEESDGEHKPSTASTH